MKNTLNKYSQKRGIGNSSLTQDKWSFPPSKMLTEKTWRFEASKSIPSNKSMISPSIWASLLLSAGYISNSLSITWRWLEFILKIDVSGSLQIGRAYTLALWVCPCMTLLAKTICHTASSKHKSRPSLQTQLQFPCCLNLTIMESYQILFPMTSLKNKFNNS